MSACRFYSPFFLPLVFCLDFLLIHRSPTLLLLQPRHTKSGIQDGGRERGGGGGGGGGRARHMMEKGEKEAQTEFFPSLPPPPTARSKERLWYSIISRSFGSRKEEDSRIRQFSPCPPRTDPSTTVVQIWESSPSVARGGSRESSSSPSRGAFGVTGQD